MPANIYAQMMGQRRPNDQTVIGQGLRMLSQDASRYAQDLTEGQKLSMMLQEMAGKRRDAMLANRRLQQQMEVTAAEEEEKKRLRDTQAKGRELIFRKRVAESPPGMAPDLSELELGPEDSGMPPPPAPTEEIPGWAAPAGGAPQGGPGPMELPAQHVQGGMGAEPSWGAGNPAMNPPARLERDPTREEMLRTAAEHEMITPENYFDHTDPSKSPDFILGKLAAQAGYNMANAHDRQEFQWKLAMMLEQGRNDRAAAQDRSKPKSASGMPLKSMEGGELKKITDIRNAAWNIGQVKQLAQQISSLAFGPIVGHATGRNPYDVAIQRLVNAVNATVPSLARGVYGEVGVLTDEDAQRYKALLPTIKTNPAVAVWIINDLEKKIAAAWQINLYAMEDAGRDIGAFDPNMTFDQLASVGARPAGRRAPPAGGAGGGPAPRPAPAPAPRGGAKADSLAADMDFIKNWPKQGSAQ